MSGTIQKEMLRNAVQTLFFCAVILLNGCLIGDPSAVRIVRLTFPNHKPVRTPRDGNLQDAVKVIDRVLVSNGLTAVQRPPSGFSDGSIGHYQGPPTRGCSISLDRGHLIVFFLEFGASRSSEPVQHICAALEQELKALYGADHVRIETRH
jgi:hypothetical protein